MVRLSGLLILVAPLLLGQLGAIARQHPTCANTLQAFTSVIVLPDDGKQPFIDEIDAAVTSIQLYIYLLSDDEIINSLVRSHVRGVSVQVILEPEPFGGAQTELETFQRLDAAGIDVRWSSSRFRFAHIKLLIVDQSVALIMNLNMTTAAFTQNREFAVITSDGALVSQATAIFESDWSGQAPTPDGLLVVSPETSRADLMRLIASSTRTVDIYAEVMTDSEVLAALVAAVQRGVQVRLVMSELPGESLWNEEPGFLARSGVVVRIVNAPYIHAKVLFIDGEVAWIGSQNFTANSLDNNRELGVVIADQAALSRVARSFDIDFSAGLPLAPAA